MIGTRSRSLAKAAINADRMPLLARLFSSDISAISSNVTADLIARRSMCNYNIGPNKCYRIRMHSTTPRLLLDFKETRYGSITVDMNSVSVEDGRNFASLLSSTIEHAKSQEEDKAVLLLWVAGGECKVPPFASHHVGVGGAVWHDNKVLVVREAGFYSAAGWKLPGGLCDVGEELGDAVAREVREETGIEAELKSVLTFRHSHNIQFGRSDIYVVCMMNLKDANLSLKLDGDEILEAKWMSLDELETVNKAPLMKVVIDILRGGDNKQPGLVETTLASIVPGRKPFKLYMPADYIT